MHFFTVYFSLYRPRILIIRSTMFYSAIISSLIHACNNNYIIYRTPHITRTDFWCLYSACAVHISDEKKAINHVAHYRGGPFFDIFIRDAEIEIWTYTISAIAARVMTFLSVYCFFFLSVILFN